MADVFLSYAHKDADIADRLAQALRAEGLSVWIDRDLHGGAEFSAKIEEEITLANKVVAVWTENSVSSRWVRDEASLALNQGKLVPVSTGGTPPPLGFRQIQSVDLDPFVGGTDQELPKSLRLALGLEESRIAASFSAPQKKRRFSIRAVVVFAFLLIAAAAFLFTNVVNRGPGDGSEGVSLVVMPLEANSGDPQENALAKGITDELIVRMRRIPGLYISTGTASPDFTPSDGAFVLRGTLRRSENQLRVSQLLEDSEGQIVWSQNFDREVSDLFYVQEEIARAVAGAMSTSLDVGVESRIYGGTDNPEAYWLYVQGRAARGHPDRNVPTSLLERAVALDPNYAKALTELSYAYGISMYWEPDAAKQVQLKRGMDEMSHRAAEAAPELWIGHAARGWYHLQSRDFVAADEALRRAAELDPGNDPEVLTTLANFHQQLGRVERARELRRAKALIDPAFRHEAEILAMSTPGRVEELVDAFEKSKARGHWSDNFNVLDVYWLAMMHGQRERILELMARRNPGSLAADPRFGPQLPKLPYDQLKAFAAEEFGAGGRPQLASAAQFASFLGDQRLALDYLRLAYNERGGIGSYSSLWSPALGDLRATPEFARWIEDLGMDEAWRESGDWGDFCRPLGSDGIVCR